MIGSPWNPFFCQTIPGTITRYDGRTVDSGDERQYGGFDAVSAPQYLELNTTLNENGPIVLTRQYDLLSTGSGLLVDLGNPDLTTILAGGSAETLAVSFGDAWGKRVVADVLKTGYCWWYHSVSTWNSLLPRFLYKSDPVDDDGRRYWFAAGINHPDGSVIEHGEPLLPPLDWPIMFTAWIRSDGPPSLGGRTVAEQFTDDGRTYYDLFGLEARADPGIVNGSRHVAPADINAPFSLPYLLPIEGEGDPPTIDVRPWYYDESYKDDY